MVLAALHPTVKFLVVQHQRAAITCARQIMLLVLLALTVLWSNHVRATENNFLEEAVWAEENANYAVARKLYQRYLDTQLKTQLATGADVAVRQSVSIRISVLDEVARFGVDSALLIFLDALTARDKGNHDRAISLFKSIRTQHPDSYLTDDALYLIGYISLLDLHDFRQAHDYLRRLLVQHPDTRYIDTALYSEAIALEQLGNTVSAKERFLELRSRHTEFSVEFLDRHWPKSTVLSRYWFDRANKRLFILDAHINDAAKLVRRQVVTGKTQTMRVSVDMDGMNLVLLLSPSPVMNNVVFKDPRNQPIDASAVRYFAGTVDGDDSSWVRVAIRGDSIEGVVSTYGTRYVLKPNTLIGTIDYYQPKLGSGDSGAIKLQDYVMHPPATEAADAVVQRVFNGASGKAANNHSVTRLANLAIVVDSQYNDYYGGNGLNRALSVLNIADGIYREDFGLALGLSSAVVYTDRASDPMNLGAVTLEQSLRNFRDYRIEKAADTPGVGLVYLFSGNQNTDEAIGLAWIGGACRSDGYDVGVTTPSAYGDLLVAHELGHSLGAQHDSDTSCSGTTNQLMWPRISALTEQAFTSCSVDAVSPNIAYGCYTDVLDLSLDVVAPDNSSVEIVIRNNDSLRNAPDAMLLIEHTAVEFTSIPGQCFSTGSDTLECRTGTLGPEGSLTFSFRLGPMVGNSMTLLAELAPVGFADVEASNNTVQLDARRTSDGSTDIVIASIDPENGLGIAPQGDPATLRPSGGAAGGALSWWVLFLLGGFVARRARA